MTAPRLVLLVSLTLACARVEETPANGPQLGPQPASAHTETRPEREPALTLEHRPELGERLAAAGYAGAFVVLDPQRQTLIVSDPLEAERLFIPASTFKIPNSLIALETGVAPSPDFNLAWDGVERWVPDWNRDHDLRSAFAGSVVWYYQELARRIGRERMGEWLREADYGNADIGDGPIDEFWLNGPLRISARGQVEFLRQLDEGRSPFSPATVTTFLDEVMIHERRPEAIVRAKTGWARSQDFAEGSEPGFVGNLGWFVGSVESSAGERVYFATWLIAPEPPPPNFRSDRIALSEALLASLGVLDEPG